MKNLIKKLEIINLYKEQNFHLNKTKITKNAKLAEIVLSLFVILLFIYLFSTSDSFLKINPHITHYNQPYTEDMNTNDLTPKNFPLFFKTSKFQDKTTFYYYKRDLSMDVFNIKNISKKCKLDIIKCNDNDTNNFKSIYPEYEFYHEVNYCLNIDKCENEKFVNFDMSLIMLECDPLIKSHKCEGNEDFKKYANLNYLDYNYVEFKVDYNNILKPINFPKSGFFYFHGQYIEMEFIKYEYRVKNYFYFGNDIIYSGYRLASVKEKPNGVGKNLNLFMYSNREHYEITIIEYKSNFEAFINALITTYVFYYLIALVYGNYKKNYNLEETIKNLFEDDKTPSTSDEISFGNEKLLSNFEPIVDLKSFENQYHLLKQPRQGANRNYFQRVKKMYKNYFSNRTNNNIFHKTGVKYIKHNLTTENILRLMIQFRIFKECTLGNKELLLFNNINKIKLEGTGKDYNLLKVSRLNTIEDFYNYITSDLNKESLFKYLDKDLKSLYVSFNN